MVNSLLRNPGTASQIQAKIDLLQDPNLYSNIVNGGFFAVDFVTSSNGRNISIVSVFPRADMRSEATQTVQWVKSGIPLLEDFMAVPFPRDQMRIWYGFVIGNFGGGGSIWTEDQVSYESRWHEGMMPFEPGSYHELSHSYIAHESLTQFLEIYQYNLINTNSTAVQDWTNYRIPPENWPWITAILDIYQLIGLDAMKEAYRVIYTLNPPYGVPLSEECQQAFVDQAPTDLKSQVSDLAAKIIY